MTDIVQRGPDGHVFRFEEGTPDHVRQTFIQRHYGTQPEAQRSRVSAAVALSNPTDKRSLGERLGDVFSNTWNTSFMVEGFRRGFRDGANADEMIAQGKYGSDSLNPFEHIGGIAGALTSIGDIIVHGGNEAQASGDFANRQVASERARRQEFRQVSSEDPFWEAEGGIVGKTLHGGAALLGTLGASALDPSSYITGGSSALARIGVQATVAGGADLLAQQSAVGATQDKYDLGQTLQSVGAGAAFQGVGEGLGALGRGRGTIRAQREAEFRTETQLNQHFRDELDLSDKLTLPALTHEDWTFRPTKQGPTSEISLPMGTEQAKAERIFADEPKADAPGADGKPEADPWNGVDWGKVGDPNRVKAATAHLDRLKTFIKPESVGNFVRWLGKESVDGLTGDASHWNKDFFDFDKLAGDPDKFEEVASVMADIFKPLYDEAGDAARSWKATQDRQTMFGITLSDAIKAHSDITGEHGVSAKIHALETIAIQHTDQLVTKMADLEKNLRAGNVSAADGMIGDVAAQLQATVMFDAMAKGSKSEIARALNIMKASKKRAKLVNDIQAQYDQMADALNGGDLDEKSLADALKRIREAYGQGGARQAKDEIRKVRTMGFMDYLSYYIVSGYLSTPASSVRNAVGSVLHATLTVGERYVAAGVTSPIRRGLGGQRTSAEGITFREANAYLFGIHQSFVDASRAAFTAFKTASPVTDAETSVGRQQTGLPFEFNQARVRNWTNPKDFKGALGVLPDMAGTAIFTTLRTLGIRPSLAMDEFTKVMTRRMELSALASREASYRSSRLRGKDAARVYAKTLDAITQKPTAEALAKAKQTFEEVGEEFDPAKPYMGDTRLEEAADVFTSINLQEMANDYARMMAFQKVGPKVEAFEKALKAVPLIKALYVPFFRTPMALVRAGMVDRNPALAWVTIENRAAFANYFSALDGQEKAMSRGGAEADLVMARMVSGFAMMSTAAMLFSNGDLVGKRSPAEEQDGIKSYSIRVGGRWYQYSSLSPLAEMLGITADLYQATRDRDLADSQTEALVGGVFGAITNNILNKAALQGIGDFFDLLDPATAVSDTSRGQQAMRAGFKKLGDSLVPAIVRNIAQEQDPVMREARGFMEAFLVNIPTLSQSLPERRDWLGLPIVRTDKDDGPVEALIQPLRVSKREEDIVRLEVSALAAGDPDVLMATRPPARFNSQKITPREHARVLEIQGQEFRDPATGRNLHETLTDIINSADYADYPDRQRAQTIKDTVSRFRRLATASIKRGDYPDLAEMVDRTGGTQAREQGEAKGWDGAKIENKARSYGVSSDALADVLNFQPGQ